jgi:hypothetical protein
VKVPSSCVHNTRLLVFYDHRDLCWPQNLGGAETYIFGSPQRPHTVRMHSMSLAPHQRRHLVAKFCRMQRELGRLIEQLYLDEVPPDDEVQTLASRAFDDIQQLNLRLCSHEFIATPGDAA